MAIKTSVQNPFFFSSNLQQFILCNEKNCFNNTKRKNFRAVSLFLGKYVTYKIVRCFSSKQKNVQQYWFLKIFFLLKNVLENFSFFRNSSQTCKFQVKKREKKRAYVHVVDVCSENLVIHGTTTI